MPADGTGNMFCADCLEKLHFVRSPVCPGCGGELSGILELCPDCLHAPGKRPWEKALSVFVMEGKVKEVIYLFKYRNEPSLARPLGMLCAQSLLSSGIRPDLMTYTPLHWTRCLKRGYNQSELLVREMARHVSCKAARLLKRSRSTRQQAHLGRKERFLNMRNAFQAVHPERFRGKKVLLVDDVLTTGATLSSASEELLKNGAAKVFVLVLARRSTDFS
ncbi:MAG: ComF family protein [Lentisphaeria bacterium]|nr:ComF family protein [Lentisphaeria bacterium]